MSDWFTTANTIADLVSVANDVRRNADEVRLLYPPDDPEVDASPILQAELNLIGSGRGNLLLASGDWNIQTGLTSASQNLMVTGAGMEITRLNVAAGVDFITLSCPTTWPTYQFSDMAIYGGRSAFRLADPYPDHSQNRVASHCVWSNLYLRNQEYAAFDLGNGVYKSLWINVTVEGDYATKPLYGLVHGGHFGLHNNTLLNCEFRGTHAAALYCDGVAENPIRDLTLMGCIFEANQGQVANLTNCHTIKFIGGWWEYNCVRVEAEPVPLSEFTGCWNIYLDTPWINCSGAGGKDPNDSNRTTVIHTNGRQGHVVRGNLGGYVDFGDGHPYYSEGPINMECREIIRPASDGWYRLDVDSAIGFTKVS